MGFLCQGPSCRAAFYPYYRLFTPIHSCTSRCGFAVHTSFSTNPCVTERLPPVSPCGTQPPP